MSWSDIAALTAIVVAAWGAVLAPTACSGEVGAPEQPSPAEKPICQEPNPFCVVNECQVFVTIEDCECPSTCYVGEQGPTQYCEEMGACVTDAPLDRSRNSYPVVEP
jgi:hypothetical protein